MTTMTKKRSQATRLGIVSQDADNKDKSWGALEEGHDAISNQDSLPCEDIFGRRRGMPNRFV